MTERLFHSKTDLNGDKLVTRKGHASPEFWRRLGRRTCVGTFLIIDGKRLERIDKRKYKARFGEPQEQLNLLEKLP